MTIDNLSQLSKLLKLCKKHGVTAIEVDGIKMNVSLERSKPQIDLNAFPEANIRVPIFNPGTVPDSEVQMDRIEEPDQLTEEQLLNWSVKTEPQ